jgi:hypothetical protein
MRQIYRKGQCWAYNGSADCFCAYAVNIAEVWAASIPLSALDQTSGSTTLANLPYIDAEVYPWIGDASAITKLSVDGYTFPDPRPMQPLLFVNDKNGTYGGAYAYVKAGASGGTVSGTPATARAAPFPTLVAALAALQTFNNTNKGHNDHSGSIVRLMDDGAGGAVIHEITSNSSAAKGLCFTNIEPDPLNTAAVSFRANTASNTTLPTMICFSYINLLTNPASTTAQNITNSGATGDMVAVENATIDTTGTTTGALFTNISSVNTLYLNLRNVNVVANSGRLYSGSAGRGLFTQLIGCTIGDNSYIDSQRIINPFTLIGSNFTRFYFVEIDPASTSVPSVGHDTAVIYNNKFLKCNSSGSSTWGYKYDYVKGMAFVQNVHEQTLRNSNSLLNFAADGAAMRFENFIEFYNTTVGNRGNRLYNDSAASIGKKKDGVKRFCLDYSWARKSDPYTVATTVSGRTGNWEYTYEVGNLGNVTLAGCATELGTIDSTSDPDGARWTGAWTEPGSNRCVAVQTNVASGAYSSLVGFTLDASSFGTTNGLGDYHLTGSGDAANAAYNRVPINLAALKYDIAGIARKNNGKGAAGAYERTDI